MCLYLIWVSITIDIYKIKKKIKNPEKKLRTKCYFEKRLLMLFHFLYFKNRDRETDFKKPVESESRATAWIRRKNGKKRCVVFYLALYF